MALVRYNSWSHAFSWWSQGVPLITLSFYNCLKRYIFYMHCAKEWYFYESPEDFLETLVSFSLHILSKNFWYMFFSFFSAKQASQNCFIFVFLLTELATLNSAGSRLMTVTISFICHISFLQNKHFFYLLQFSFNVMVSHTYATFLSS